MGQQCCCCCCRKSPDCEEEEANAASELEPAWALEVVDYVVALYAYQACGTNEISFNRGDTLEVLNKEDEDWWLARYPGHTDMGYIPLAYVALSSSLESHEWYHGDVTRVEAEQRLLSDLNQPGAFLLRKSQRPNNYALSVKSFNKDGCTIRIKHFNVPKRGDHFLLSGAPFLILSDLVDYFIDVVEVGLPPSYVKHPCVRPLPARHDISRETKDLWEIPREDLEQVKKIGHGSFGEVWLGKWNGTVDVAIKTMKEGKMDAKDFLEEAKVMKGLRHPNVLALYAVCTKEKPLLIITEFMPEGSLLDVLRNESINLQLQLYIATQAAAGMEYLETKGLIHRDLAARNILVGQCYVCKVADFGLSKAKEDAIYAGKVSRARLPIKWTAPEALLHEMYSNKSDVWSFGVLMMEIVTHGAVPYPGYTNQQVLDEVMAGYRMPRPKDCPEKLYDLIKYCWQIDSQKRPTFYFLRDYLENFGVQSENCYY